MSGFAVPPALLVAMSHTSCGMGMRMNLPPVVLRMGGGPKVPVYVKEPSAVEMPIWMASASPGAVPPGGVHVHWSRGASRPRGKTVLSYG